MCYDQNYKRKFCYNVNIVFRYTLGREPVHFTTLVTEMSIPHWQRGMDELARYGFGLCAATIGSGPSGGNVRIGLRPAMYAPARRADERAAVPRQHAMPDLSQRRLALRQKGRWTVGPLGRWSDWLDQAAKSADNDLVLRKVQGGNYV